MKTVILDNYDSFTYNLYQLVAELSGGIEPLVSRNDAVTVDELKALAPDNIIISPGPGAPSIEGYFGVCREIILQMGETTPILGVCLGYLGMAEAFGGKVIKAPQPRHGKTSRIHHTGQSIFTDLADPFEAMRYHSLIVDRETLPDSFQITAWTEDNLVMGVQHKQWPLVGVQFHPESIGTTDGPHMMQRFLTGQF